MKAVLPVNAPVRRAEAQAQLWMPGKPLSRSRFGADARAAQPAARGAGLLGRLITVPVLAAPAPESAPAPRPVASTPESSATSATSATSAPALGAVVHEMRNFLAPMDMSIELLKRMFAGDPRSAGVLDLLQRQTSALRRLVEDLLELERVAAGKLDLHKEGCDLDVIADDVAQMCAPAAAARSISVVVQRADGPVTATGDGVRLRQALSNVVFNSIRYTPQGGHVKIESGTLGARSYLRVSDDGRGIDRELLARIFEPYVQAKEGEKGGLGIGLYLVRTIMKLHGGEVEAASDGAGRGSVFTLWLPL